MIHEEEYDASVLEEALAFMNTSKQAARIHCATIGWDAFEELMKEGK
jgi:nitrogen fixation NifU-like protein